MINNKLNPEKFCKTIEHADSLWEQTKGLMFRKSLPKGHGMLFTFGYEGKHGIWMMFMRFPIDIYFLDKNYKVVDYVRKAKPFNPFKLSTWRIYSPKKPAKYVLEVASQTAIS
ncbi:MAG: DUF192 domain-containing protein [Nanoarchaeota archaeon]|nr:DUF192 domain-containing protein [Nanoarchaeota archaeon]